MAHIKSTKHSCSSLVLLASALPFATVAAEVSTITAEQPQQLATLYSQAEQQTAAYQSKKLASKKFTQALLDTPQTVTVIQKELAQAQGLTSLVEALRNTPGITAQLGENGNTSAGDTFQLRGFSVQQNIFADGVRDLGAVTRDVFNVEQIEVFKGSGAAETGRNVQSGFVNTVTKLPNAENSREANISYNTAQQARATVDLNQQIDDSSAVRLNVYGQQGGVDGRDEVEYNGFGFAPSLALGLDTPTRLYLYSQHVRQNNIPDGGIPTIGMQGYFNSNATINAAPKVNPENFYGSAGDFEDVRADIYSFKIEHDINDHLKVQNISRFGNANLQRELTAPTVGATPIVAVDPNNRETWTVNLSRQGLDQDNTILANQTNINSTFQLAGLDNDLLVGTELLRETQQTNSLAVVGSQANNNLYNPNPHGVFNPIDYTGAYSQGQTDTFAAYLLNTVHVTDRIDVSAGIRSDRYMTTSKGQTVTAGVATPSSLKDSDLLVSWRAGALFKPTQTSSIYANYSKSLTPPGAANFSLTAASSVSNAANSPDFKPQQTETIELGSKWDVLAQQLSLAAALYRSTNRDQVTQDAISRDFFQEGETQVQGIELSAIGALSSNWNLNFGMAYMDLDSKNQQSVNATTGVVTTTQGARWSPNFTATLWTDYTWNAFNVGLGARYVAEQDRVVTSSSVPSTTATSMPVIPAYYVFDAALRYDFSDATQVQLNLYNVFDQEYINTLNNAGGRVTLGQPLSAKMSLNYTF